MPTLKQITCQLEKAPSRTPLKEYSTSYGDGVVETFVAIPDDPTGFEIHLTSTGYISSGLAMYVYIDGVYQCNRHRLGLMIPDGTVTPDFYEVNFRVRQKEEKLGGGKFVARPWRFEKLNIATADAAPNVSDDVLGNLGTIEVVVLRCQPKSTDVVSAEPANDEPANVVQAPRDSGQSVAPVKKTKKGVAIKKGFVLGKLDGAGDDHEPDNFGAGLDGPYGRYDQERNYDYEYYDRARSRRSRRRRPSPGPPPRSDFGPSYADYLRWIGRHPDAAAAEGGRGRQRSASYYEQYRPNDRSDSRDPRQRSHRRRVHAEDGIPSSRPRSFWTFEDSNGCIDPLEDLPHHHIPVRSHEGDSATSIETEAARRPRASGNFTSSRFHSVIDSTLSSPRTRGPPEVRRVHFGDDDPNGNPFGHPARSDSADPAVQPLFNPNHVPRHSYRRNEPDASLLSTNSGPDPRYNPRYQPRPPRATQPYAYMPNGHASHSRMPGGWDDPYESAAIPNPFATRFLDTDEQDKRSNLSQRSSHHSGSNRPGSENGQGGDWNAQPDNGAQDGGWNNNDGQNSGWDMVPDAANPANGDGGQAWHDNTGSGNAGWGDSTNQAQEGQSGWEINGGDRQDAGGARGSWNNADASNNTENTNWNNAADNNNDTGNASWDNTAGDNNTGNVGWDNPAGDTNNTGNVGWDNTAGGNSNNNNGNTSWDSTAGDKNNNTGNAGWDNTAGNDATQGNNDNANPPNQDGWNSANQPAGSANGSKKTSSKTSSKASSKTPSFKWPDDPAADPAPAEQPTTGDWNNTAAPEAAQPPAPPSRKPSSKPRSKKPSVSSSLPHRPAPPAHQHIKSYWHNLRNQAPLPVPAAANPDPDAATTIAPSEPPLFVPEATVRDRAVHHHVHAGRGHSYTHVTGRPEYVDGMERPYAVFRFKYRSAEGLRKVVGREVVARDKCEERKEEWRRRLEGLSREELVEEVLRKSAGGGSRAGSKAGSKAAAALEVKVKEEVEEEEKKPSVDKWVDAVVAATASKAASVDEAMTCDRCNAEVVGEWWHCDACDDYDICMFCVANGKRCNDKSHELAKWKDGQDVGGFTAPGPTGEKMQGITKDGGGEKAASVKGGSQKGWDSVNAGGNAGGGEPWAADNAGGNSGGGEAWNADNAGDKSGDGGGWTADNTANASGDGGWDNTAADNNGGAAEGKWDDTPAAGNDTGAGGQSNWFF